MYQRWFRGTPWVLILSMLMLSGIGILFIYSAAYYQASQYAMKQLFWVFLGVTIFLGMTKFSYRRFMDASYLLYWIAIALLVGVLIFGRSRLGAQRWIDLGPFALQPSELAKLATVIALANYLGTHHRWESKKKVMLVALAMTLLPVLLIMQQPDLGTALLFLPMMVVIFFLWGLQYRYLIVTAALGALGIPILWNLLKGYQKNRLAVFLNPGLDPLGAGYTALQSRIAVGSGGLFGKGFLSGTQSQLDFVPEHHTDFIFCVIGEEWGYLGALLLLILYGLLFNSAFHVIRATTDLKAKLLGAGIIAILFAQVFINIGMSIGLMPITGLTLPLVSYGGSSFITTSVALGLFLSIHRERSIF